MTKEKTSATKTASVRPARLAIIRGIDGRQKRVDSSYWLFDSNNNKGGEVRQAKAVIDKADGHRSGFIGRPSRASPTCADSRSGCHKTP